MRSVSLIKTFLMAITIFAFSSFLFTPSSYAAKRCFSWKTVQVQMVEKFNEVVVTKGNLVAEGLEGTEVIFAANAEKGNWTILIVTEAKDLACVYAFGSSFKITTNEEDHKYLEAKMQNGADFSLAATTDGAWMATINGKKVGAGTDFRIINEDITEGPLPGA